MLILPVFLCAFALGAFLLAIGPEIPSVDAVRLTSFPSLQAAINAAKSGDTVFVPAGTYYEHVVVNKSLTLFGEGWANTIISGDNTGVVVQVTANDTSISGFTVQNGAVGISLISSCSSNISANVIVKNGYQGLYLSNSHNNIINENNLTNDLWGITLEQSNNNLVLANSLDDNYSPGISLYDSCNNTVSMNSVRNNPVYGIYLANCQNNTVSENSVSLVCDGITLQSSENNSVIGNTVTNTGPNAIDLEYSDGNRVEKNILDENEITLQLLHSSGNLVRGNNLTMSKYGLLLRESGNNTCDGNHMVAGSDSLGVFGNQIADFVNDISSSNTVDGRPVYYWVDHHSGEVPGDAGYVGLVNSTNVTVANLTLENDYEGVLLANSNQIIIRNVTLYDNSYGVMLFNSSGNLVTQCAFQDNIESMWLNQSNYNTIYWNNFMGGGLPEASGTINAWDNGYPKGGNYWAAFAGTDQFTGPYQNATGSDGISDVSYGLSAGNKDRFPLMSPIEVFDAGEWGDLMYSVSVISNSTVSGFSFSPSEAVVSINVTGQEGVGGFCRVVIPGQLLWAQDDQWTVLFEGKAMNYTRISDQDNTYFYVGFTAGSGTIQFLGTQAVPEFQNFVVAVLLLFFSSTFVAILRRKSFSSGYRSPKLK